jgi:uncharacterized protein YuzE
MREIKIKVMRDEEANAAYIAFTEAPRVAYTLPVIDKDEKTVATLDFGDDGELLGVELIDAANQLPRSLREGATGEPDG